MSADAAPVGIEFEVNGQPHALSVDPRRSLLDVLRNELGLRGTHFGCGTGECGACMVRIDGHPQPGCQTPVEAVAGHRVQTVEGLGTRTAPHPVQTAFIAEQAVQCGYCTAGLLVSAAALLEREPASDEAAIRAALSRHLCRCGTHPRVIRAIRRAAGG